MLCFLLWFLAGFEPCASLNHEGTGMVVSIATSLAAATFFCFDSYLGFWLSGFAGLALLRFREMVEADPGGALLDWDQGDASPCSWFGVECSGDGRVVGL